MSWRDYGDYYSGFDRGYADGYRYGGGQSPWGMAFNPMIDGYPRGGGSMGGDAGKATDLVADAVQKKPVSIEEFGKGLEAVYGSTMDRQETERLIDSMNSRFGGGIDAQERIAIIDAAQKGGDTKTVALEIFKAVDYNLDGKLDKINDLEVSPPRRGKYDYYA